MSKDLVFSEIIETLTEINNLYPDIKFCDVIQSSIDLDKRSHNVNLFNVSSKSFLKSIKEFKDYTKNKRGI